MGAKGVGRDLEIPKDIHVMQVVRQMVHRPEEGDHDAGRFLEYSCSLVTLDPDTVILSHVLKNWLVLCFLCVATEFFRPSTDDVRVNLGVRVVHTPLFHQETGRESRCNHRFPARMTFAFFNAAL